MAKVLSAKELAEVVTKLLTDPATIAAQLDQSDKYGRFMTDLAGVVCDHVGGDIRLMAAAPDDDVAPGGEWVIGIHGNDSLPEDGGVWSQYDPEGELFDAPANQPKG